MISLLFIIGVNLIPIFGVIFWNWSILSVIGLYWLESWIVGFVNILKMIWAKGGVGNLKINNRPASGFKQPKGCIIPFFMFHYGIFMAIQGVFIFMVIPDLMKHLHTSIGIMNTFDTIKIPLLVMGISHLISFYLNYIRNKKYQTVKLNEVMFAPYGRIFIQQFVIILGSILIMTFQSGYIYLVLLIILKIIADIVGFQLTEGKIAFSKK